MRDRDKVYIPHSDNELCPCEGEYYSTRCIIVNSVEGHENTELNELIRELMLEIDVLKVRVSNLERRVDAQ